jgi:mRNA interferase RelE/StbE
VWAVGARADAEVYAEAAARIKEATEIRPELVKLAEVIDQLGRAAGGIAVERPAPKAPVPDWLAERLIFSVGMQREEVAALDLQEAVDLWTTFMSKPK